MKIVEQTPTHLKFENHNWQWLAGVLLGIPFVAVGAGIVVLASNLTVLECQRSPTTNPAVNCQRTITGLLGTETDSIYEVMRAGVTTAHGTGVVLSTAEGQVELVNHRMTVREKHRQIAEEINTFINNPQRAELTIRQDDRLEQFMAGATFFFPGIAVMWVTLAIPVRILGIFDKVSGQMTIEKHYRLFNRKVATHQKLSDIQQAQVHKSAISDRTPVYLVNLTLTSAEPISLSPPMRDRQQCEAIVNSINQFLKS